MSGDNALCTDYCSIEKSFLKTDVSGRHCWLNAPFDQLHTFIQHYKSCKRLAPGTTSACIVVPDWHGPFRGLLKGMQLLRTYQKGTVLFNAPESDGVRRDLPGIPWAVHVYYDAPVSSPVPAVNNVASVSAMAVPVCADKAVESHPLTTYFKGTVAGLNANVLIDSGASEQCVS
jgi:hypothetical protein